MKATLETINQMQTDGIIGRYAIGGAVGATFYLEPAATLDVDIFVTLPGASHSKVLSLAPIYDYLKGRGFKAEKEHVVIGEWPVQFLPPSNDLEREALEEAVETDIEGVKTWVMSAEHLVAIALNTARSKDHARILQFLEQRVVNADKLNQILVRHGLVSKWKRFQGRFLNKDVSE